MKTKPWIPPVRHTSDEQEVLYPVDQPCLMSGAGTPFNGPFPLALCMLQGLELVRQSSKFEIKSEDGDRLLELRDGKVWGIPVLVDVFMRQNELLGSMFDDLQAKFLKIVSQGKQDG